MIGRALEIGGDMKGAVRDFAAEGVAVIDDAFSVLTMRTLREELDASISWRHVMNGGAKVFEIARADYLAMPDAERARIAKAACRAARTGFQYRYDSIRVSEDPAERSARGTALDHVADGLNADDMLRALRSIVGEPRVGLVDAQATAYRAGDFLTGHDDDVAGKGRIAAYVLSLNPGWRPEWGGLLLFHDADGQVRGVTPAFNRLTLFRVPRRHSVSEVSAAAGAPRYSVTGWLRVAG